MILRMRFWFYISPSYAAIVFKIWLIICLELSESQFIVKRAGKDVSTKFIKMSLTMTFINLGIEMLNSTDKEENTFLNFVEEYFLDSWLVISWNNLSEQLFWLSCMFQTLVIVVDIKNALILVLHDLLLVIHHFNNFKLIY